MPMLLGILPSITLAGIPDLEADALAEKRTLAVRFGFRNALRIALFFVLLSATAAWAWDVWALGAGAYNGVAWLVLPHAAFLAWLLYRHIRVDEAPGRIDGLMVAALSYVLWFGLVPLLNLALL
jgi:4-hydroxybenzoate polyprenyltransferase